MVLFVGVHMSMTNIYTMCIPGNEAENLLIEQRSVRKVIQPVMSANQLTSISAMIVYISHKSGLSEFCIERKLANYFFIPNPKCLPANSFDRAIRYLADILSEQN